MYCTCIYIYTHTLWITEKQKTSFGLTTSQFQVHSTGVNWHSLSTISSGQTLRLFQHTFGTHPEQPLPTGYKPGFLSYLALPGDCNIGCAISGCVAIFLEKPSKLAYVRENPPPKQPYKVQYLHFRYLKFLVIQIGTNWGGFRLLGKCFDRSCVDGARGCDFAPANSVLKLSPENGPLVWLGSVRICLGF